MKVVVILTGLFALVLYSEAVVTFKWSKSYTLKATLTVPAANISEPYQVWLDGDTGNARVDFYDGIDKLYRVWDQNNKTYTFYKIYPETTSKFINREVCTEMSESSSEIKMYALNSYLPVKRWTYVRPETVNSVAAHKFKYDYSVSNVDAKVTYAVWVTFRNQGATAVPVRYIYELKSNNKTLDYFRHDYSYFDDNKPEKDILLKPLGIPCNNMMDSSLHIDVPVDPLAEYIEPKLQSSRVAKAFHKFQSDYNKHYANEVEYSERLNTFKQNLRYINSFNRQHGSYKVGVNHLVDLTDEELSNLVRTINPPDIGHEGSGIDEDDDDENNDLNYIGSDKANFDWRDYGAITPIKDQTGLCGACYAFTAAAALESAAYVARGCKYLDEISEQAIIDCSGGFNFGCRGGILSKTLEWVKENGVPFKKEYGPYLAMEGLCHNRNMTKFVKIADFINIEKKKREIKNALRKKGPLLAAIDAKPKSFFYYAGGFIYNDRTCSSEVEEVSHGVTIVGYGIENGEEYWIIKNSFGAAWGENGYMRLATKFNICGLKNHVYSVDFRKNFSNLCMRQF